jgi:hypothetical protein
MALNWSRAARILNGSAPSTTCPAAPSSSIGSVSREVIRRSARTVSRIVAL